MKSVQHSVSSSSSAERDRKKRDSSPVKSSSTRKPSTPSSAFISSQSSSSRKSSEEAPKGSLTSGRDSNGASKHSSALGSGPGKPKSPSMAGEEGNRGAKRAAPEEEDSCSLPEGSSMAGASDEDLDAEMDSDEYSGGSSSPLQYSTPCEESALEPSVPPPEVEEPDTIKSVFRKVTSLIRKQCDIPDPPSAKDDLEDACGLMAVLQSSTSKPPPNELPPSKMFVKAFRTYDAKVSGPKPSLAASNSRLLPPSPLVQERHWYRFLDGKLDKTRKINPELSELLGKRESSLASLGATLSSSELLKFESLTSCLINGISWLDHWVNTIGTRFLPHCNEDDTLLLNSGCKVVRFLCHNATALYTDVVLKRRDGVLSGAKSSLPFEERSRLRNTQVFETDDLFPAERILDAIARKKKVSQENLLSQVSRIAINSSSKGPSSRPPSSAVSAKKKQKKFHRGPATGTSSSSPLNAPRGQQSFRGGHGYRGKKSARGRGRGRN